MIKILFLSANPKDTMRLSLGGEFRAIHARLIASECRESFVIMQECALQVQDLQAHLLRHKPNILHFSGHGSRAGEILLETDAGIGQPVPVAALEKLFGILKTRIPTTCVVLNACFSKAQAEAIAKHVRCVIGMSDAIHDEASISFSSAFYQALGFGESIHTAFELARNQLQLENLGHDEIPQLIVGNRTDPAAIYLARRKKKKASKTREQKAISVHSAPGSEPRAGHDESAPLLMSPRAAVHRSSRPDPIEPLTPDSAPARKRGPRLPLKGLTCAAVILLILLSGTLYFRSYRDSHSSPRSSPPDASTTAALSNNGETLVWVNTASHIYHCPGDYYYKNTTQGELMTEKEAISKNNRPDHFKPCR